MADHSMDWKSTQELFAEVCNILDTNKALSWTLAGDSIREACNNVDKPETIQFLERCWLRVLTNMTQFSPAKIGPVEKRVIEESLYISAKLVAELLPNHTWALYILGRIFDGKIPFYYGLKTGFQLSTGYPAVRIAVAKKFAENHGFQKIANTLRGADAFWCGSDVLQCILGISNGHDIAQSIDDRTRQELVVVIMERVLNLPDEIVKKENTDALSSVIQSIGTSVSFLSLKEIFLEKFFSFWFDCIIKYINSSSIVVRLFGWEQMAEIIQDVKAERPFASSYIVEGAGTPFVNGEYLVDPNSIGNDCVQYVKEVEGLPVLTLFRCNMRNSKSKWWFISQADLEKPGTEKDIDYYVHRSTYEEEREPSSYNWANSHPGMVLHGKFPTPILKRGEGIVGKEGDRENSLDLKLIRWFHDQEIISQVFSTSMHREIISRSLKYLQFLQEYEALSVSKLHEIWNAGIKSREKDICDEIFSLIVQILATSSPEVFEEVLNFAGDSLKTEDGFAKVVSFLEKFSLDEFKNTHSIRSPVMIGKLLSLAWDVYSDKRFAATQGTGFIQDLLSFCFRQKGGLDIVVQKVRDCKAKLDSMVERSTRGKLSNEEEDGISQILHTLFFLISKTGNHDIDSLEADAQALIDSLIAEVTRYTSANRSSVDTGKYVLELRLRLQVLRKFYSIVICKDIDSMIQIWDTVCQSPAEIDEFSFFLKGEGPYDSIFVKEDVLVLYDRIFCSDKIDWSTAGERTFECFRSYFHLLEGWSVYLIGQELPPKRGLSTLWNMCLSTDGKIGHDAIELLLIAYESFLVKNNAALVDFIETVFEKLRDFSLDGSQQNSARASRCIDILQQALTKFGSGKVIAHAARGTQGRVTFSVYYKRANYATSHLDTLRFDKSGDGFVKLEMHPYHTIKMLKAKIIDAANLSSSTIITFDSAPKMLSDHARLFELGDLDGSEISVSYQINYTHRVYDDDSYGTYYAGGKLESNNFGQLLIDDLSKFDILTTLCQQSNQAELVKKVWTLLMLLPTQTNMVELIRNMAIQSDPEFGPDFEGSETWKDILVDSSRVRITYLLQILDYLLRPATEADDLSAGANSFLQSFGRSEGLATVMNSLIQMPEVDDEITFASMAVCLHVIYSLVFCNKRRVSSDSDDADDEDVDQRPTIAQRSISLLTDLSEADASVFIDKLLLIARGAAVREDSNVVHDALVIISLVIRSPAAASQMMKKGYTRVLLTSVLRNKSKKLRDIAANFAIQIGKVQTEVFQWLFAELKTVEEDDEYCSELFRAMVVILSDVNSEVSEASLTPVAEYLVDRLLAYPAKRPPLKDERFTLLGYLELLEKLLTFVPQLVLKTKLGKSFIPFVKEFLLVLPDEANAQDAVCDTPATRSVGFRVVSKFLEQVNDYDTLLDDMQRLTRLAAKQMHYYWGMQVSFDIKRPDIDFIGLKNQGCTCYMNSLLQVLYMCPRFRDAVLNTPIRESHRTTLWHYDDVELVDKKVMFEWSNNEWRQGRIVGFDPDTHNHRVQYTRLDGSLDEIVSFNIHEGRLHRETGRVKLVPSDEDQEPAVINEREDAAFRVMEQLQRTFAFMKHSKKKYFDPRPFVDACKTLNLSFNVYHQNDASEFCDQLLDRVETATKGKHTKVEMWDDVFLKTVFGGKMLTQKIPQDCPAFNNDKDSCGLWQSPRLENYLKVELQIRGNETVAESLNGLVQGELMDGDNKIQCDVCNEKKAAVMRTCIGNLPNVLLLHLKRFDLDFQTFETVKLNSKMEFPMTINMLKYTKDGIDTKKDEEGEGRTTATIKEENDVDPDDYEYELQGILVHAGVAQGGHYYSFVRSYDNPDLWFKFDDEDVTPFTADQIPDQCYGGPYNNGNNNNSSYDDDRTANALMLLYNKKKVPAESSISSPQSKENPAVPKDLVTGAQAFAREVTESNLQHTLTCFLVDPELHSFVRTLVSSITKSSATGSAEGLVERVVQFGVNFLLDVLLHFRERSAIKDYLLVLKEAFEAFPTTATWFLNHLLSPNVCSWFTDYMLVCTDPLARISFVQLVVSAVSVVAPKDATAVTAAFATIGRHTSQEVDWTPAELCVRVVQKLFDLIFKSVNHVRTADEVFAMVRDLAGIPSMCHAFRTHNIISLLSYFVMPDMSPPQVKGIFDKHLNPTKNGARPDYSHMLQNIFEAIAALIGVPQVRKVNLLQDKLYWESELVAEARDAFITIFQESSRNGSMDQFDVQQYMDKVLSTSGTKASQVLVRNTMDRMSARADHRVYQDGFLTYQTECATINPKNVWRDLHAFGYRNDLSRIPQKTKKALPLSTSTTNDANVDLSSDDEDAINESRAYNSRATSETAGETGPLELRDLCRQSLHNIAFYEAGLIYSPAAARAIAQRICTQDEVSSNALILQALNKLFMIASDYTWNHLAISSISDFLAMLLSINDGLQNSRFMVVLVGSQYGLANVIKIEKERMQTSTMHDYSRSFIVDRYLNFVQRLMSEPGLKEHLHILAEEHGNVRFMRGMLKLNPTLNLTYDEENRVRNSRVIVSGAGTNEVNGEYQFVGFKAHAGAYERHTTFDGKDARFILYKCSLRSGGFQWFISITPVGQEPGTNQDIDFYFTHSRQGDHLPPLTWYRLQNSVYGVDPTPKFRILIAGEVEDSSDSNYDDNDNSSNHHIHINHNINMNNSHHIQSINMSNIHSTNIRSTFDSDSDLEDEEALVGDDSQLNDNNDSFLSDP